MAEKQDIRENTMSGGTPARLRGLAANGNSISPTLEEVMNAMGIYTYSFTLAAKEEKDLGDLGYGMYLLASPNNAATAIFAFGSYSKGFVSDAGSNFYCDYTDGTKGVAFGRKTTNGSFFIKNNRSTETYIVLKGLVPYDSGSASHVDFHSGYARSGHLGQNGQNTSCQCSPFMG